MMPFSKHIYVAYAFIGLLVNSIAPAQTTPFTASWSFEGTDDGVSSSEKVTASSFSYSNVRKTFDTYFRGYAGLGNSIQYWSSTKCDNSEYVEFSVQPKGTAQITLSSLSFAFSRSAEGPPQLMVRSSVDEFSSNIFSQTVTENYQIASIALSNPGFSNQTGPIRFRIYACISNANGGALRLDEIQINATVLPVTLVSFTAKPEGDRVQVAWETTSEYNANRFVVERSRDLGEYVAVGEVAAKGTTDTRQYYGLTDLNPQPGINYYRLKQIDHNGTIQNFRPIAATIQIQEPVISVYPNPASPDRIHMRLWNAEGAFVRLLTATGQAIDGFLDRQAGEADLIFEQPLPTGIYWVDIQINGSRKMINVMIR